MGEITMHYKGRYLDMLERDGWEYASRCNASGVVVLIAVTDAREILLVEQYRKPIEASVIELPAGLVGDLADPDESLLDAARRELEEETGYAAEKLEILMACPSSAGMSDEVITFVLATELRRVGPGGGDESEEIEVTAVALDRADAWLAAQAARGKPIDPKVFTALYWLQQSGHHRRT
jgi:ADP-ribose pyrophosphatase